MLNVLLESKAQHTRRVGGTLTSALVHGAIITGAVLLTIQPPHPIIHEVPEERIRPFLVATPVEPQPRERRRRAQGHCWAGAGFPSEL